MSLKPQRGPLSSKDTFLAIDDSVFQQEINASRCLCKAVRHGPHPILDNTPGGPDAHRAQVLGVAARAGRFQMWYLAHDARGQWHTCYAQSEDGYTWVRPELGLFEYKGSKKNNIVEQRGELSITNICLDQAERDPARRYKAPVYGEIATRDILNAEDRQRYSIAPSHPCIETFAYSPDGIHWTYDPAVRFPLQKKVESGALYKIGTTWFMAHQMIVGEYPQVCSAKRYLGISHSTDLKNWQFADEPGFYFNLGGPYERSLQTHVTPAIVNYGNVAVGIEGIFYDHPELYEQETDLTLILTNDGFHWRQPLEAQPLSTVLRRGHPGQWDASFIVQGGLVNSPDKTLLYYTAGQAFGNLSYVNRKIGMAELPRDRFGYLTPFVGWGYTSAEPARAELISHPIRIQGKGLRLLANARGAARPGDSLKAHLLDEQNRPIDGYTLLECENITQDGLEIPVRWKTLPNLDRFEGQLIRVAFELVGANPEQSVMACTGYPRLFAFYFR
jgi:hypothetical protein